MSLKAKVEAILFMTDKPIRAQAIARLVNADVQLVRQTLLELIHDYEERGGGLEIAQDNGYTIQVKDEYSALMEEFLPVEMSAALLRTLSAIAIKQPVPQSEIIRIRGAGAYDQIKELVRRELVAKKDDGRSPMLTTTKKFQEYFRLTKDAKSLRHQLKQQEAPAQDLPAEPPGNAAGQLELPLATVSDGNFAPDQSADNHTDSAKIGAVLDKLLDSAIDSQQESSEAAEAADPPFPAPAPETMGESIS